MTPAPPPGPDDPIRRSRHLRIGPERTFLQEDGGGRGGAIRPFEPGLPFVRPVGGGGNDEPRSLASRLLSRGSGRGLTGLATDFRARRGGGG